MESARVPVKQLILVPAVITFAVTLLRLFGELQNWSPTLFNKSAGGGLAPVGISWLILVFGAYFAVKLVRMGHGPESAFRAFGLAFLALAVTAGAVILAMAVLKFPMPAQLVVFSVVSVVSILIAYRGWRALGLTLLAYAFAARIPVALLMLFAIYGNWGTHYDVAPPEAPQIAAMSPFGKWLAIGLLPQMTVWIYMTVVGGMLVGSIAAMVMKPKRA
jgi:hypothetical protein